MVVIKKTFMERGYVQKKRQKAKAKTNVSD